MNQYALGAAINSFMKGAMDFLNIYRSFQELEHKQNIANKELELKEKSTQADIEYKQKLGHSLDVTNRIKEEKWDLEKQLIPLKNKILENEKKISDLKLQIKQAEVNNLPEINNLKKEILKYQVESVKLQYKINKIKYEKALAGNAVNYTEIANDHLNNASKALKIIIDLTKPQNPNSLFNILKFDNLKDYKTYIQTQETLADRIKALLDRKDLDTNIKTIIKTNYKILQDELKMAHEAVIKAKMGGVNSPFAHFENNQNNPNNPDNPFRKRLGE